MERIIQNIVSYPGEKVSEIEILSEPEIEEIIIKWNQTEKDYPKSKCLHNYFEEQVKRTPNNTALIFKDQELTYQEFNEKANQLANFLKQNGVRPARLVGILMERSLEMLIAIYGALKAGCAYVPLDPEYPNDRLKLLIEDINAAAILTQSHLLAKISDCDSSIISIDKQWGEISKNNSKDPEHYDPSNLAYVIYTSGSTGRPKGVMIEHKSICNRLFWMQEEYCLREGEAVLQKTPFTFDVSVWELFWPLLFGAKLVIAEPQMHRDSAALVKIINEKKISTIHFVPSMLQVFLEDKAVQTCKTLKRVFCSGEALPFELQTRFFSLLQADLHNLYGPTEAAVDVSYWPCEKNSKDRSVPIGKPVANTQLYILNKYLKPVPVGITGELYIGGVQVARGYLNLPEMTKEKFIDLPIGNGKGGRLYKTGDLCLFRRDGNIEYLGRNDFQIKIRGLRVEIGEIEALIKQISGMREVIVLAREDEPGDKRIIAYFINSSEMKVDVKEISKELRDKLPAHMIPSAFVPMDAFPLTSSGKIDRRGFPRPEFDRKKDRTYVEPKGKIEREISEIWRKLLKVEKVGLQDNFFDLGGNSLLLIRALNRLREMYGGNLSIMDMFKHPTVENLGGLVRRERIREEAKIGSRSEEIYLRAKKQRGILNRPRNIDIGRKQNE
jgi:amino acid adenylation domain-containing protein